MDKIHFYRGRIEGTLDSLRYYIAARSAVEAENKMLRDFDNNPTLNSFVGEVIELAVFRIFPEEYYGLKGKIDSKFLD